MKLIPSLLLAGALLVPTVAMASPRLNVPSSAAKGYRSAIPVIPLTPSRGVNVDFSQIEEKVYQVLSDNKALLHVEAAPPLEQGASLVHLTALRDTGNTSITFITLDKSGETNHYVFEVKLGSPGPYFIAITPDAEPRFSPTPAALTTKAFTQHQEGINAVQAGMRVAVGQGLLTRGSSLWQALEKFIAQVNQGVHPSEAARSVGIKQSVLSRLIQMGQGSLEKFPAPSVPTPEEQEMAVLPHPLLHPPVKKNNLVQKRRQLPFLIKRWKLKYSLLPRQNHKL
ncbi:hypothetical protein [Acaryochloris sp. CCMEE 5410]|uniref:hypothetical protein n=1 Tax=Acaryochloris sp. CCMEE 5410 TaxID=310037 RepID=UPI0021CEF783|nr:hypothetical protein [Acaryochloris sp. CCMEE 5410]KAI9130160.1 hypothetical protein ON05_031530 [Acaryochloris sp. CCMEE 5410]